MISAAEEWRARHPLDCFFPPRIHHTVHQMNKTEQYSKKKCCFIDRIPGLNEAVYGLDYYSKTCRFEGCEVI
jgi:hypothetical protein